MKLKFGFSPCPNDTFIFDAIINGRVFQKGIEADPVLADIETLNRMALNGIADITKLSCSTYPFVSDAYQLLNAGSALGRNCGPVLIQKGNHQWNDLSSLRIAIPGKLTTANLLLTMFAPKAELKTEVVFSEIEDAVLKGKVDVGLIIHESRFTYQEKGLKKLADLGEIWEATTGAPLPLGCIAIRRTLPEKVKAQVDKWIHDSVRFAFDNPQASRQFIQQNASEMSESVQKKHIDLYVNEFSLDLGKQGRDALQLLFIKGKELHLLPEMKGPLFISSEINSTLK